MPEAEVGDHNNKSQYHCITVILRDTATCCYSHQLLTVSAVAEELRDAVRITVMMLQTGGRSLRQICHGRTVELVTS